MEYLFICNFLRENSSCTSQFYFFQISEYSGINITAIDLGTCTKAASNSIPSAAIIHPNFSKSERRQTDVPVARRGRQGDATWLVDTHGAALITPRYELFSCKCSYRVL